MRKATSYMADIATPLLGLYVAEYQRLRYCWSGATYLEAYRVASGMAGKMMLTLELCACNYY
jgi:hypothetical protein